MFTKLLTQTHLNNYVMVFTTFYLESKVDSFVVFALNGSDPILS
jgi:hypothetical protein